MPFPIHTLIARCLKSGKVAGLYFFLWLFASMGSCTVAYAQATEAPNNSAAARVNTNVLNRLHLLASELEQLSAERDALAGTLEGVSEDQMLEQRERLVQMTRAIATMNSTFEVTALAGVDTGRVEDTDEEYNWRSELIEIASPVLDSLKSITEKPRRKAELLAESERLQERLELAEDASNALNSRQVASDRANTTLRLQMLTDKWRAQANDLTRQQVLVSQQIESISKNDNGFLTSFGNTFQSFFLGRGLTILLAFMGAMVAWGLAKFVWWFSNRYLVAKRIRRKSFWYRLFSYSYFLVTFIFIIFAIFLVLYLRDDILLIALMFLLLAAATLSLRNLIPQYMKEARLLLNLGAVREEEMVIYDGLPWIVRSLNLYSILHNPKLTGIVRLPMDKVKTLVSRPVKDTIWFPTTKNDYIFLPDGAFGQVVKQTPDLVEVQVRGGMVTTFRARDFYALKVTNISRNATFGVCASFVVDHANQPVDTDIVNAEIIAAIRASVDEAGYGEGVRDIIIDMQPTGTSSLAYVVYLTVASKYASNYFSLQRLVQKVSVDFSNSKNWTIPNQKLAVHSGMA